MTDNYTDLRQQVIEALVYVQKKAYFAHPGTIIPCHEEVDKVMALITQRETAIAKHLAFQLGYPEEEIIKYIEETNKCITITQNT